MMSMRAGHGARGATTVEYALIASLIAVVVIVGVILLGANLLGLYNETATSYADAT
jgi:Flp pilus assembly pilin Flp